MEYDPGGIGASKGKQHRDTMTASCVSARDRPEVTSRSEFVA
jgi:hypothetical protein